MNSRLITMMLVIITTGIMINMDGTAVNLALITMARDLHTKIDDIQWVMSAYLLSFAAFLIPTGNISDRYGHRKLFCIGILLFTFSSVVAGLANASSIAIGGRIIQGIGAAVLLPAMYGLIAEIFPHEKQNMVIGLFGGSLGIGLAIGPTLAGVLIELLSWRWIFFINIPIGMAALITTLKMAPKSCPHPNDTPIDFVGSTILIIALTGLLYSVNNIHIWGFYSLRFIAFFCTSILLLAAFIVLQLKIKNPLMDLSLYRNMSFSGSCLIFIVYNYCFIAILLVMGLYMQDILHLSALNAGLLMLANTITYAIASPVCGKIVQHMNITVSTLIGLFLIAISMFLLSGIPHNLMTVGFYLVLVGIGEAFVFTSINIVMMKSTPKQSIGVGSGMFYMSGMFAGAASAVISTLVITTNNVSFSAGTASALQSSAALAVIGLFLSVIFLRNFNR